MLDLCCYMYDSSIIVVMVIERVRVSSVSESREKVEETW